MKFYDLPKWQIDLLVKRYDVLSKCSDGGEFLNGFAESYIDGINAVYDPLFTERISPEAQEVLRLLSVVKAVKVQTQEVDGEWFPYKELAIAISKYCASLQPPVDIETLKLEVSKAATAFANYFTTHQNLDGSGPLSDNYKQAVKNLEIAQQPKPLTRLELAEEVCKALNGFEILRDLQDYDFDKEPSDNTLREVYVGVRGALQAWRGLQNDH